MMKSVLDVTIGDFLTGQDVGLVVQKFNTMGKDRSRMVALSLEAGGERKDVSLPVTAVVAVKAQA